MNATSSIIKVARYECTIPPHNKFWEASVGKHSSSSQLPYFFQTRYGALGTLGAIKTKTFSSEGQALRMLESKARTKICKGYILISSSQNKPGESLKDKISRFKKLSIV